MTGTKDKVVDIVDTWQLLCRKDTLLQLFLVTNKTNEHSMTNFLDASRPFLETLAQETCCSSSCMQGTLGHDRVPIWKSVGLMCGAFLQSVYGIPLCWFSLPNNSVCLWPFFPIFCVSLLLFLALFFGVCALFSVFRPLCVWPCVKKCSSSG